PRFVISWLRAFETRLPAYYDGVMSISPGIRDILGSGSVTLDGADVGLFKPLGAGARAKIRRTLGVAKAQKLVVFHGTIEAHHGQQLIPRVVEMAPELRILIVGGGS